LQSETKQKIKELLNKLAEDPYRRDLDIKALRGELKGKYRLRHGDLSIVYFIDPGARLIFIDGISFRGSTYEYFKWLFL